jgi:hypothetical protein
VGSKSFEHQWILDILAHHPGFRTRRMFGGLAAYLHERLMLVLVEPTKTGRWKWHGVLIATSHDRHEALRRQWPRLAPHEVLAKWLYLDSREDEFESDMQEIAQAMARQDPRFGIVPKERVTSAAYRRRSG